MIIEVPKINPDGDRFVGEEPASILDLSADKHLTAEGPIRYDFSVQVVSHELVVRGTLKLALRAECSRCADFVSTTVADLSFLRAYDVPVGTETVDLTGDIREDILVNLPTYPLCSPDCKGLCPRCGANWNRGPCACKRTPEAGGGWDALDKLKLK